MNEYETMLITIQNDNQPDHRWLCAHCVLMVYPCLMVEIPMFLFVDHSYGLQDPLVISMEILQIYR